MKHVHLFSYNVPKNNQYRGKTDVYIHVIAEWNGDAFYSDGRPMIYCNPVNMSFYEAMMVKNWSIAKDDIYKIAEQHFAELARMERINQARAILAVEGPENPITERINKLYE